MKKVLLFLTLLLAIFLFRAAAQNPEWINYTYGKTVTSIAAEGDFVWCGTEGGLARLDRLSGNLAFYNKANSGLPDNYVHTIAIDGNGNKWIGTALGDLAKFDGTNWTVYNSNNSGLPSYGVTSIAIDAHGNKWIGTSGGGLAAYREGGVIVGVEEQPAPAGPARSFLLEPIYPNPFNGLTTISFTLAQPSFVRLAVYDLHGRKISMLLNENRDRGRHQIVWEAKGLAAGIYVVRLETPAGYVVRKAMLSN